MEQLDLEKANSENLPTCRVCGQPMRLLNKEIQRWYCYEDDQLWLGKEEKWVLFPNPIHKLSQKLQSHEINDLRREVE
jgi:hypothetical protein